ncbi:unnamed protein product [Rhizopus stolonifer]
MTMHFQLAENSASNIIRRGTLHFSKKNKTIQTPACLTYTLRGYLPHLASDNLKPLPIEFVQVTLEHFLEQKGAPSFKFPQGLHTYLHLENALLFCDVRDPYKLSSVSFNTDNHVSVKSHAGIQRITPDIWAEAIHAYRPDVVASMADTISDVTIKSKRIPRSVNRTLCWLDENLVQAKKLDIPLFAHLMGHHHPEERARSAQETAERDVQGFILNMTDLDPSLLLASIDKLPKDRPRMAYGLSTPERILAGISHGVDLFDGSYAHQLTLGGHAMVFKFGQQLAHKTLCLHDPRFAHDFDALDNTCGCHACSRHSKAYIHHLLNAHEMLGPILLMSHNVYQLEQFMADVRISIQDGSFEENHARFVQCYSEDQVESLAIPSKNKRTVL